MGVESDGERRLRIGPWVPDPPTAPMSGPSRDRHPDPVAAAGDPAEARPDVPAPVGVDDAVGWGVRHRQPGGPADRRRWLVVAAIVVVLGVAVAVPLLGSSPPPRAGSPAVPVTSLTSPAGAPAGGAGASGRASPDPSPSGSPVGSPSASASGRTARPSTALSGKAPGGPAARPAPVTYEAEAAGNDLGGSARVADYPGASGGRIVRNIGDWKGAGADGWLRFNDVTAPATGTYLLTLFSVHLDDEAVRTVVIAVSGSAPLTVPVTGSGTCCAATRQRVTLQRGANTVTFTNPDGHAPSIDKIVIEAA
jgi:hypothetical protein